MSGGLLRKLPTSGCLLCGPVLIYGVLIFHYGVNFPFLDDYGTVLHHLLLPGKEQVTNLFAAHNEHIHLILKTTVSVDAALFGEVNFVRLMWIGSGFFLILYLKLLSSGRSWNIPWLWMTPLPFLLFQPSYWGTITWSTTALHNFPGILFAFLALVSRSHPTPGKRVLAVCFLILALLTHGFGIAALISVILWEAFILTDIKLKEAESKSFIESVSIIAPTVVMAGWILLRVWQSGSMADFVTGGFSIFQAIHFFTNFLGSCIHFLGTPWVSILAFIQLGSFLYLAGNGLIRKNPVLFFFMVYLILCAIITTLARAEMGPGQGLASRYRIFSTLLMCGSYLGFAQLYWENWDSRKGCYSFILSFALLFYGVSLLVNLNNLDKIRGRLLADKARWAENQSIHEFPLPEQAARILTESEQAGIFRARQ